MPAIIVCISILSAGMLLFIISLRFNDRLNNYVFGIAVFITFYSIGLYLKMTEGDKVSVLDSRQTVLRVTISDFPSEKEKTYLLTAELKSIINDSLTKPIKGSMIFYYPKDTIAGSLRPGDDIIIRCTPLEINNRGNPYEFDYKSYMLGNGFRYYSLNRKGDILSSRRNEHIRLKYHALIIRQKIIGMFEERGMTGENLALASAITLGQKNMLDTDQKQIFITAGIMHIMAVSGLHVVILSMFIMNLLFFLKGKLNPLRIIITVTFLWGFAFVTGLSPSVLRATIMFTFLQTGELLSRKVNSLNSVLASAFLLILIQPSVIWDSGFLLSYAAVIYIIGFYNALYNKFKSRFWIADKLWQSVAVTLIAQAGTLPLTIMLFNRFPVYFIFTNLIIVPVSNLLIITGSLVPLTYHIVPVSTFLTMVLDKLTWLTEYLTRTAAALPLATIDGIGMRPFECFLLTLAITFLVYYLLYRRSISLLLPLSMFVLFAGALTVKKIENRKGKQLIVYNNPKLPSIGFRNGNTIYSFSQTDSISPEISRHAATMGLKIKVLENNRLPIFLNTGKERIIITDSLRCSWQSVLSFNTIVLMAYKPYMEYCQAQKKFRGNVIVGPEANTYYSLKNSFEKNTGCRVWYVRSSGAWTSNLE